MARRLTSLPLRRAALGALLALGLCLAPGCSGDRETSSDPAAGGSPAPGAPTADADRANLEQQQVGRPQAPDPFNPMGAARTASKAGAGAPASTMVPEPMLDAAKSGSRPSDMLGKLGAKPSGARGRHAQEMLRAPMSPPAPGFTSRPNAGAARPADGSTATDDRETGERFKNYGENDFIETAKDKLSTFAIDVDTASYTIMRRDVTAGRLPNPDGVRIEEYVNYFGYDYPAPASPATPFSVTLEAAPSPFSENVTLLRVGIQGYRPKVIKAANLVFLIDKSGSMSRPNKLPLVTYALKQLTKRLDANDTIGIVTYAGGTRRLLEPTAVKDKAKIYDALDTIRSGGGTAGAAGIQLAYEMAAQAKEPNCISRVVLCTDGDFNIGLRGDALVEMVESYRDRGIFLTILLFGRGNINDADMERAANKGNGNYAFIDSKSEATRALGEKLVSTLQVIAKDVKIQVEFSKEIVTAYRLIGYENRAIADRDFRNDKVDAGELGAGHSVTAYYELKLVPGLQLRRLRSGTLATVRVRHKTPDAKPGDAAKEQAFPFSLTAITPELAKTSDGFRFGAAVAQYAQLLRRGKHVKKADFETAIDLAENAVAGRTDRAEFLKLSIKASDLPEK